MKIIKTMLETILIIIAVTILLCLLNRLFTRIAKKIYQEMKTGGYITEEILKNKQKDRVLKIKGKENGFFRKIY